MYKVGILIALMLSGCAHFTINAAMCKKIASEPNSVMPHECKNYDKKKADKAFNKVVEEKKVSDKDIQFNKKEEE